MEKKNDIKLRAPEPEDLEVMMQIENDTQLWGFSGVNTGPYSRFQLKRYIDESTNDIYTDRQLRLMVEAPDGNVAGMIDVFEFDVRNNRAEIGIAMLGRYRGRGFAAMALEVVMEHCSGFLGMKQLYSYVLAYNKAACSLFRKCGFVEAGILKSWVRLGTEYHDVLIFQKIFS